MSCSMENQSCKHMSLSTLLPTCCTSHGPMSSHCPRLQTSWEVSTHFVPMFLHTALSAQRKSLRNLTPAATSISQRFESLLLGWRPRSIRSTFFGQRAWQCLCGWHSQVYLASRACREWSMRVSVDAEWIAVRRAWYGLAFEL
jgi:hypothetical protein